MLVKLLILIVTLNTVGSQLLLKRAVQDLGAPAGVTDFPRFLFAAAQSPWVYGSLLLQVTGYALWIVVVSQERLGVAFALSGAFFYFLVALSAWMLYDERLTTQQWLGLALITAGVLLVTMRGANGGA